MDPTAKFLAMTKELLSLIFGLGIFIIIIREIAFLFMGIPTDPLSVLIDEMLIIFILIKVFGVVIYLVKYGRISVQNILEVGIITVVKDLMFKMTTFSPVKILVLTLLLLVLLVGYMYSKKTRKETEELSLHLFS